MKKFYNSPELEIVKFTAMETVASYESDDYLEESENDWYIDATAEE